MQYEISALKQLRFKKAVTFKIPLNKIDDKGETEMGEAHFIAHFVQQDKNEAKETAAQLEVLQANILRLKSIHDDEPSEKTFNDYKELEREGLKVMEKMGDDALTKQWVGIEKHPLHEFPFLNNGVELGNSAETISLLAGVDPIKEAVRNVYLDTVRPGLRKLLEGNSNK